MNEPTVTIVGNLVADPELRYTADGIPVCNFRVASTPRFFNRDNDTWDDGETMFLSASIWREPAENVAASLVKGQRVIVHGNLKARTYETNEGEQRTVFEIDAKDVGPSLMFFSLDAPAKEASHVPEQRKPAAKSTTAKRAASARR